MQEITTPTALPWKITYKGIEITLRNSGYFSATIGGRFEERKTLDAIKKEIVKYGPGFQSFDGYITGYKGGKDTILKVRVTGMTRNRGDIRFTIDTPKDSYITSTGRLVAPAKTTLKPGEP